MNFLKSRWGHEVTFSPSHSTDHHISPHPCPAEGRNMCLAEAHLGRGILSGIETRLHGKIFTFLRNSFQWLINFILLKINAYFLISMSLASACSCGFGLSLVYTAHGYLPFLPMEFFVYLCNFLQLDSCICLNSSLRQQFGDVFHSASS